jgi:peroxiredoxin
MTTLKEGDMIPNVTFKMRVRNDSDDENPFEWKDMTTEDLFGDKRIVLFSLPGAFTPTCSSQHLPQYEKHYQEVINLNVDDVYCLSVNDAFVMRQWGLHQNLPEDKTPHSLGFQNVKLLPDGACLFTDGMGMSCTWTTERGFGRRSWRYSMVVNNMKIEKLLVEEPRVEDSGPDPFEVSDVNTILHYLKTV